MGKLRRLNGLVSDLDTFIVLEPQNTLMQVASFFARAEAALFLLVGSFPGTLHSHDPYVGVSVCC